MVKNSRLADKKLRKLMKGGNCKSFVISVIFIVTENKRKGIKLLTAELFSRKFAYKLKLLLGKCLDIFFFRNYSPL